MYTVQCVEPGGRPAMVFLDLNLQDRFEIFLVEDAGDAAGLRQTVLRKAGDPPPPGSSLLVELQLTNSQEGPNFRVNRINPRLTVEIVRPDGRGRLASNTDLANRTRLEVQVAEFRSVGFLLEISNAMGQGAKAMVAGGGGKRSSALAISAATPWIVPALTSVLAVPWAKVTQWVAKLAKRLGLSPYMITTLVSTGAVLAGAAYVAYTQYREGEAAKKAAEEASEMAASAEASRDAALAAEASCLAERHSLVKALGERTKQLELLAEQALQLSKTNIAATELGGSRMKSDAAKAFGQADKLKARVVAVMGTIRTLPSDPQACTGNKEVLGSDLPEYTLLWHPDERLVCPADYDVTANGVVRRGRWALSDRAAAQYGPAGEDFVPGLKLLEDRRNTERWSAAAHTNGLRATLDALLGAPTGERPPVAPDQAHLWGLALWGTYNRLAIPADGSLEMGAGECVGQLLEELVANSPPAEPGQPVLPDVLKVASGEAKLSPTPTAACSWPEAEVFQQDVVSAMRAVAYTGLVIEAEQAEKIEE